MKLDDENLLKWFLFISIFSFYLFPYIILGENSFVTVHDNLDSDIGIATKK